MTQADGPRPDPAARRAQIRECVLLSLIAAAFVAATFAASRPTLRGDVKWAAHLIVETPKRIFFSSHLAQVGGWAVLETGIAHTARDAMSFVSRCAGVAWAAVAVAFTLWTGARASVGGGADVATTRFATRVPLLLALLFTPVTVFFCGYEELGHLGAPLTLLAVAVLVGGRSPFIAALAAGSAAAIHGVGFALAPGVLVAAWMSQRGAFRRIAATFVVAHVYFAPTIVCVLAYRVFVPGTMLTAGDAFGGASGRLLLPFWGEYRGTSLWSVEHLGHVARMAWRGAPAVVVAAAACALPSVRAGFVEWVSRRRGAALLAFSAFGFVVQFYPGYGPRYDADLLIPACALTNVAACLLLAESRIHAAWTWAAVLVSLVGWLRMWEWLG